MVGAVVETEKERAGAASSTRQIARLTKNRTDNLFGFLFYVNWGTITEKGMFSAYFTKQFFVILIFDCALGRY